MGNIVGTTGEALMWSWYCLRRDNGAVLVSECFFWRCTLGCLSDLSQCLQLPLTCRMSKLLVQVAGHMSVCCVILSPFLFFCLFVCDLFTIETLQKQTRSKFHLFQEKVCLQVCISVATAAADSPVAQTGSLLGPEINALSRCFPASWG